MTCRDRTVLINYLITIDFKYTVLYETTISQQLLALPLLKLVLLLKVCAKTKSAMS